MNNINIRIAEKSDFDNVYNFISKHWDGNPLYSVYPEMMKYHHLQGERLNFVMAQEEGSKEIVGLLGFIQYSQEEQFDIGTAVWKTISSDRPMLGLELLDYLAKYSGTRVCIGCGTKAKALPLVKYLGWHVDWLKHYYRLADKENYQVAVVNHKEILPFDATKYRDKKPYKDEWFIENRYFNHPMYKYQIYGVCSNEDTCNSIMIVREIEQNNVKILRVVDYIGDVEEIRYLSMSIQKLMDTYDYEYGVAEEIMKEAGFARREAKDTNIIPCYFEPYEQTNVELSIITTEHENICIFKGDADQDFPRPMKACN